MTTWSSAATFTPVAACALDGGTVRRCWWDFLADERATLYATDFTEHNGDHGSFSFDEDGLRIAVDTQGSAYSNSLLQGPYVEIPGDLAGDFDASAKLGGISIDNLSAFAAFGVHSSGGRGVDVAWRPDQGMVVAREPWDQTNGAAIPNVSEIHLRLVRSGSTWTFHYKLAAGDAWSLIHTWTGGWTTPVRAHVYVDSPDASPNDYAHCEWIRFASGHPLDAVVQVHDAGEDSVDAGAGDAWDNATITAVAGGSALANLSIRYADSATTSFGSYSDWIPLDNPLGDDFGDEADTGLRYRKWQFRITGPASELSAVELNDYDVDVTPPAGPTATKFVAFETDRYALDWQEPADADFHYCNLRRDDGGVTEYLQYDGSWSPSVTGSELRFVEGVVTQTFEYMGATVTAVCVPVSAFVDDSGPAAPAYFVKAFDEAGNASAWTAFSPGAAALEDPPAPPELAVTDSEDGATATATVTGADAGTTNAILTRPRGGSAWTESATVPENGAATLTLEPGAYWAAVRSSLGGVATLGAVVGFWITSGDDGFDEVRTALRARLAEDSVLAALLAGDDPVTAEYPDAAADLPALVYALAVHPDRALDAAGAAELRIELRAVAETRADLDRIAGAVRRLLDDTGLLTPHWDVRPLRPLETEEEAPARAGTGGAPHPGRTLRYAARAFRRGA